MEAKDSSSQYLGNDIMGGLKDHFEASARIIEDSNDTLRRELKSDVDALRINVDSMRGENSTFSEELIVLKVGGTHDLVLLICTMHPLVSKPITLP